MELDNKYIDVQIRDGFYSIYLQDAKPNCSAKETLEKINLIVTKKLQFDELGGSLDFFRDVDGLKSAADHVIDKFQTHKEHFFCLRRWLLAITNFFDELVPRPTYEFQLKLINNNIAAHAKVINTKISKSL